MWIAIQNAVGARQGVGGGPGPGPGPGPDPVPSLPVGFAAAYSVRKLDSAYAGPCLEAYRLSDGATQDIGFDSNGDLDTAAILAFAGGAGTPKTPEVRVRTWYDQSGNGVDATQTTDTFMPLIYNGSAIYEENGKPTLAWTVSGQHMDTTPNESITAQSNFVVFNMNSTSGAFARVLAQAETGKDDYQAGQYAQFLKSPTTISLMSAYSDVERATIQDSTVFNQQGLWTAIANGTSSKVWLDSGTRGSDSITLTTSLNMSPLTIRTIGGAAGFNQDRLVGNIQEVLIYNTDQESAGNRNGIEYNINDYYSVFNSVNPMPASSSGLLFDYPDASAAYSVRQLNNNATFSMRVRRAVPPYDEQDIGFTASGDLDEAAIVAFGGSDVLTVSGWYDQTGNQNHATQITAGNQPQIYNGTAVVTENGKPALERNSNGSIYMSTPSIGSSSTATMFTTVTPRITRCIVYYSNGYIASESPGGLSMYYGSFISGTASTLQQRIQTYTIGATDVGYINGVQNVSGNAGGANIGGAGNIGGQTPANRDPQKMQEIVIYLNDDYADTTNRTGIETNINDYYNVYTVYNPDAPTSGFLFDYSGATAAYSIRQLNNNATYAMRVRRNAAPFDEQDIGFDGSGNLDTSAISTFGGSDEVVLSRWYDQTGDQNHSGSVAAVGQLLIYDGTSVLTKNGKPIGQVHATSGNSSSDTVMTNSTGLSFTHSLYSVMQRPNAPNSLNMFDTTNGSVTALYQERSGNLTYGPGWTSYGIYTYSSVTNQPRLYSYIRKNGTDGECFNDGVSQGTTTAMNSSIQVDIKSLRCDRNSNAVQADCGGVQEFIAYPDDRTAVGDNANILANIKAYFTGIP